ncbi:four-carbon acid sugar kinase family protein [Nonomuraea sp. KM88]|uniref:four-carbon acid sugar kinase family protein n=1 Tax=Nonomuraea sp. KM88 TaxID=3457427 RepID=UPI003FCDE071
MLDDDPTGTQAVADVPVVTTCDLDDVRWALRQPSQAVFIQTNTRSLGEGHAAERNRRIVDVLAQACAAERVDVVLASRGDSTLRGHYPLETDVLSEALNRHGRPVRGVVLVPAYLDAGRVTVHSVHYLRTGQGLLPVGRSQFAEDATFGYHSSDLRDWVEEKTRGRIKAADVVTVTLTDIRVGGPERVTTLLRQVRPHRPAVVDAAEEDDLRTFTLGLLAAEREGLRLIYRVGPSFVRTRAGQAARPPLASGQPRAIGTSRGARGLIAVGSHVQLTTAQLSRLRLLDDLVEVELRTAAILDPSTRDQHIADVAATAGAALRDADVVISTTRTLAAGDDPDSSLAIARRISAALTETVAATVRLRRPGFVVAKGGITSSDIATHALGISRAIARGTLLPGIVSLWEPVSGPFAGVPYIVFAGNVGDETSLADVVTLMRSA